MPALRPREVCAACVTASWMAPATLDSPLVCWHLGHFEVKPVFEFHVGDIDVIFVA